MVHLLTFAIPQSHSSVIKKDGWLDVYLLVCKCDLCVSVLFHTLYRLLIVQTLQYKYVVAYGMKMWKHFSVTTRHISWRICYCSEVALLRVTRYNVVFSWSQHDIKIDPVFISLFNSDNRIKCISNLSSKCNNLLRFWKDLADITQMPRRFNCTVLTAECTFFHWRTSIMKITNISYLYCRFLPSVINAWNVFKV